MSCYLDQCKSTDWTRRKVEGKDAQLHTSARQVLKNVSYTGDFLSMLASLPAHALPTILTGLATGLLSGGINKAISGDGLLSAQR